MNIPNVTRRVALPARENIPRANTSRRRFPTPPSSRSSGRTVLQERPVSVGRAEIAAKSRGFEALGRCDLFFSFLSVSAMHRGIKHRSRLESVRSRRRRR